MPLPFDPEILAALLAAPQPPDPTPPPVGDVATRRRNTTATFDLIADMIPAVDGIEVDHHVLTTADGADLPLSWYRPVDAPENGSAALYLHGGGMLMTLEQTGRGYDAIVRRYVAESGVPLLVVDYRAAPEHPHPTPVEDCYAALQWLAEHAGELGVDPGRLAAMGDSGGGGLSAGVALLARDRGGPALALQLLIYPMLDDRNTTPDPQIPTEGMVWSYDDNRTGWGALLGDRAGGADVPVYAAPAREQNLAGLPPAYLDTGDLDIFRAEIVDYAYRLAAAGVPTELHVHPGCPHGFEMIVPDADASRRAIADRVRRLRAI
ncbi:alpha/beta hydrolase [Mycobacterium sp. NPDC050041]|uniref:alpha/beta hydrolase n=1 Tax=Mycobacterium sp. NPDC050041 TaxID=3364293 RepID=UPI003C2D3803